MPGICYHSSKVRNVSLVSFSLSSSLNNSRQVLFNVGSIVEIVFINERHHSECVDNFKRLFTVVIQLKIVNNVGVFVQINFERTS